MKAVQILHLRFEMRGLPDISRSACRVPRLPHFKTVNGARSAPFRRSGCNCYRPARIDFSAWNAPGHWRLKHNQGASSKSALSKGRRFGPRQTLSGPAKSANRQAVSQTKTKDENQRNHCRCNHRNYPCCQFDCIPSVVTECRRIVLEGPTIPIKISPVRSLEFQLPVSAGSAGTTRFACRT